MTEFDGQIYANTEDSGDIFRSVDGVNWQRIHDGRNGSIGCGLAVLNDQLYALNYRNSTGEHGKIMRMVDGVFHDVYDSGSEALYLRELVSYGGHLWVFGVSGSTQGVMLRSADGDTWHRSDVGQRYFRGHVWNDLLWLGSSNSSFAGGAVAIWTFDGVNFTRKHDAPGSHVTDLHDLDGLLFASTSSGFKEGTGPSHLLLSDDGGASWRTVCTFDEAAAWGIEAHAGELYVGTWHFQRQGTLYKVEREQVSGPDCAQISRANPAWEVCEWGEESCGGVFTDGAGCEAFCAAAGMVCAQRYEGSPGCQMFTDLPLGCDVINSNQSDACRCRYPDPGVDAGGRADA